MAYVNIGIDIYMGIDMVISGYACCTTSKDSSQPLLVVEVSETTQYGKKEKRPKYSICLVV